MNRLFCLSAVATILLTCPSVLAQRAPAGPRALEAFVAANQGQVGAYAVRLADGAVLASHQPDAAMLPASVQKLLTSAVALAVLGPGFEFTTVLAVVGDDLAVIGDGDPTLGDPALLADASTTVYDLLDAWAARLRVDGLAAVGRLLLDDAIFQAGRHPDWPDDQHQRWYCAPAGGLNFHANCLHVTLRRQGDAIEAEVAPHWTGAAVNNEIRLGQRDLWGVRYGPLDASVTLFGQANTTMLEPLRVAVNEPALLLGRVLADRLARAGIAVAGPIERQAVVGPDGRLPAGGRVLAVHRTPIGVVLAQANKRSINMVAECLLLRSAVRVSGRGTYDEARQVGTAILIEQLGLEAGQFHLADGSGMSRQNRLSARGAVDLLQRVLAEPYAEVFWDSLAVSALDGTLGRRMPEWPGRVVGKTGSLSGVTTLAGYVLDNQGRPAVAFAFLFNRLRAGSHPAREVQEAFIRDWITALDAPR